MYQLFEIKKILSLVKPSGTPGVSIQLSAYSECSGRSILALVCDNGYLLFYYLNGSVLQPVIRQLNWFCSRGKEIKALSFDPSGTWLLLVTLDASVYILPVLPLVDPTVRFHHHWKADNLTEIKLSGQRAPLTSVRWWQTLQGQHIAVIGSELGEIAFINLINKKEVGGTYITVGISALDILKDESHDTTYLLITGSNRQQWRLLLEEKSSNFYWPFNSELEVITCDNAAGLSLVEKGPLPKDEKDSEQKPHRLSKFESGTFLTPQSGVKRNLVSAYNSSSCVLQVLEGDLNQMHLFSYQVPADCENVVLSDKLIFITQTSQTQSGKPQSCLRLLSRKFAEICLENSKKKEHQSSEIQTFYLDDSVMAIYKRSFECCKCANFQNALSISFSEKKDAHGHVYEESLSSINVMNLHKLVSDNISSICNANSKSCNGRDAICEEQKLLGNDFLSNVTSLDGCYLILKDTVWECRLRLPPEILFLSLTTVPTDLPMAEKLGVMLGLEIHKLYEIAAEMQLSHGQFAQAVHLYQLSKCPQLKRIAHFMSYGYLSELIAYIQVLFSTKSVEIVSADKCHFANIALHCFAQQAMEKVNEWCAITVAFKKFLRDNVYYDEAVAVKLFAEQGLFGLLYYFTKVRAQHGLVVEMLLQTDGLREAVDSETYEALADSNYNSIISHSNSDDYILCLTTSDLLQYLAANPSLLSQHLQHLISLLPKMSTSQLIKVASLFDLSRRLSKLAIRNISATKQRRRYWSTGSASSILNDKVDLIQCDKEVATEEDLIKFFIFLLLMLCHKLKSHHFTTELISCDVPKCDSQVSCDPGWEKLATKMRQLACGFSHVAYCQNGILFTWGKATSGRLGNGDVIVEFENPRPVNTLIRLQVKVLSVSCGAAHTVALTDFGVFSWGSSRYGQLGLGDIQRSSQPVVIESLINEHIVDVQCGQYHSLALTREGRVYSWGWGVHGQLGHGNPEDVNVPKLIDHMKLQVVIDFGAGQGHTVLLTNRGEIYTFGCGMFGQLGIGSVLKQSLPQLVSLPEPIVLMSSGYFHTVAVSKTNKVYIWGCNPQALRLQAQCSRRARQNSAGQNQSLTSQQNHGSTASSGPHSISRTSQPTVFMQTHLLPNLVDCTSISSPISHISCGSHHSVIVTVSGKIFTWGRNMEGQIGNGTRREQKIPGLVAHLSDSKVVYAACGSDFTIALDSTGKVWGWGKNDCGQVGQKPVESTAKVSSSLSSGRVITIRTNRRMITITQPCRQSLLRPVEITLPKTDVKTGDFDNSSYENDYSIPVFFQKAIYDDEVQNLKALSLLDEPPYGPRALHATLKAFHSFCDSSMLLNHCLSFSNFQAAAKVCILQSQYGDAIKYQLMSITADLAVMEKDYMTLALYVIEFYCSNIEAENTDQNIEFLSHVLKFWIAYELPVQPLEMFLQRNLHLFSYALCILLFRFRVLETDGCVEQKVLSLLSVNFCLNIITAVINRIQNGSSHFELLNKMMTVSDTTSALHHIYASDALTAWNDTVPPDRLWHEILHNVQKGIISHSALHLGASDVDNLAKALITEKLSNHQSCVKDQRNLDSNFDTIVFSCNHHYTLQAFRTIVVPTFKESVLKLPCYLPSTLKYLLNCYHLEGFIPSACPRCVLNEIKSEL